MLTEVDPQATALELELRFMRPKGFKAPRALAGMEKVGKRSRLHTDHYFDAPDQDGKPILKARRCTLRVRQLEEGRALVTFKQRGKSKLATARLETEEYLHGPAADPALLGESVNYTENAGLKAARSVIGKSRLVELFRISCLRTEHSYRSERGELTLCDDRITYPDGSSERRIEVELIEGDEQLLGWAEERLRRSYPSLERAPRGKQSEGRRRLSKLL